MATEIRITTRHQGCIKEAIDKLNNLKGYKNWWPFPLMAISEKGIRTEVSELCTEIALEKLKVVHQNIITLRFTKGFFRGTARWIVTPDQYLDDVFECTHFANIRGINNATDFITDTYLFKDVYSDYIKQIVRAAGFQSQKSKKPDKTYTILELPSKMNNPVSP